MGVEIQLLEFGAYRSYFCLKGWMESEVYKEKVNTRDELVARNMDSAALIASSQSKNAKTTSGELHVLLPSGLKSALKSKVGFLNGYFELLRFTEIISITNKCNQYVIFLSFIHFVRLFRCNIQTAVSPHPFENWTHVYMTLFSRNSPY